jgi:DNA-binding XRE family transcriptional regulator
VKTPHTKIEIEGEVSENLLKVLRIEYGEMVDITDEEYIDPFKTDWYKSTKNKMTPGDRLRIDRENKGFTQQNLGLQLGKFSRHYISDLENGRKNISIQVARKLSVIFDRPVDRYL